VKIINVLIEDRIKEKILNKHNIKALEIKEVILNKPFILKTRSNRYMAIGYYQRFVTIIFEMVKNTAFIITAYPSSEAQKRLHKDKK